MQFFIDFLPIILFFIAYKFFNLFIATYVAIAAAILHIVYMRLKGKKIEFMQWATLATICVLGGATLFFQNELFIKWKPTAVYWLLSLGFLTSQFVGQKPLARRMMERSLTLADSQWKKLNLSWVLFFTIMGGLNIFVLTYYDTNTWVNFKLFGTLGLTLVFILGQAFILSKQVPNQ